MFDPHWGFSYLEAIMLKDLTGSKYGKLTVISYAHSKNGKRYWNWSCECGGLRITHTKNLNSGDTISCGCMVGGSIAKDMTGITFGKWKVLKRDGAIAYNNKAKELYGEYAHLNDVWYKVMVPPSDLNLHQR